MMKYSFSDQITSLKASAIREILKTTSDPMIISFAAGNPSSEAFPCEKIEELSAEILGEFPELALQYGLTEGYPPLQRTIKDYLKSDFKVGCDFDETIIVSGAQQAIDLAARAFINKGDTVICENPSFIGALNCFKANGARLAGVPVEKNGIDPEQLEQEILRNKNVKLLYIIPNFQNPTGITTSFEKRKAIYDICVKYGVIIIEDDPYGDLRFEGEGIPPIKSLDVSGNVIYCGSFSKILAPGIRVGHVTASREIINRLVVAKQASDVHTNMWAQLLCYAFMTKFDLYSHLKSVRKMYMAKRDLMISRIEADFSDNVTHTTPEGGLFIWCTAPPYTDIMEFCRRALEKKVAVVPGTAFLPYEEEGFSTSFRMNFSTPSDEEIIKGVSILGELTKEL